jgi:hypothetical protein
VVFLIYFLCDNSEVKMTVTSGLMLGMEAAKATVHSVVTKLAFMASRFGTTEAAKVELNGISVEVGFIGDIMGRMKNSVSNKDHAYERYKTTSKVGVDVCKAAVDALIALAPDREDQGAQAVYDLLRPRLARGELGAVEAAFARKVFDDADDLEADFLERHGEYEGTGLSRRVYPKVDGKYLNGLAAKVNGLTTTPGLPAAVGTILDATRMRISAEFVKRGQPDPDREDLNVMTMGHILQHRCDGVLYFGEPNGGTTEAIGESDGGEDDDSSVASSDGDDSDAGGDMEE